MRRRRSSAGARSPGSTWRRRRTGSSVGLRAACAAAGREAPRALRIRVSSNIPVARGLGSSAAAVVAGAVAATGILGFSLTDEQLLDACAEVEGHPDNVAAAIYGGCGAGRARERRRASCR